MIVVQDRPTGDVPQPVFKLPGQEPAAFREQWALRESPTEPKPLGLMLAQLLEKGVVPLIGFEHPPHARTYCAEPLNQVVPVWRDILQDTVFI